MNFYLMDYLLVSRFCVPFNISNHNKTKKACFRKKCLRLNLLPVASTILDKHKNEKVRGPDGTHTDVIEWGSKHSSNTFKNSLPDA